MSQSEAMVAKGERLYSLERFGRFYPNRKMINLLKQHEIRNFCDLAGLTVVQICQVFSITRE